MRQILDWELTVCALQAVRLMFEAILSRPRSREVAGQRCTRSFPTGPTPKALNAGSSPQPSRSVSSVGCKTYAIHLPKGPGSWSKHDNLTVDARRFGPPALRCVGYASLLPHHSLYRNVDHDFFLCDEKVHQKSRLSNLQRK